MEGDENGVANGYFKDNVLAQTSGQPTDEAQAQVSAFEQGQKGDMGNEIYFSVFVLFTAFGEVIGVQFIDTGRRAQTLALGTCGVWDLGVALVGTEQRGVLELEVEHFL